jgi:energy-converting hydrogenase A subunit R
MGVTVQNPARPGRLSGPEQRTAVQPTRKTEGTNGHKTAVITDWEGPWVLGDHAFMLTKEAVPRGDLLFSVLSDYVIYLAYIKKADGYQPGDTLKLIVPFLIAHDVEENTLDSAARGCARFISGSKEAAEVLQQGGRTFKVVSAGYTQYLRYTTSLVSIPQENTKGTEFPIDEFRQAIRSEDKQLVKGMVPKIIGLKRLGIEASSAEQDISPAARSTIAILDGIFHETLPRTSFGPILEKVKPMGGRRKLDALMEAIEKEDVEQGRVVAIGDSITDMVMLLETKQRGGLAISFNGNAYAIRSANVAVASADCIITPILVQLYERSGIDGVERATRNWGIEMLRRQAADGYIDKGLFIRISELNRQNQLPMAYWITNENICRLTEISASFRESVRGVAIGSLA